MSDPLDDMIRLRAAGSGPVFDDDSHVYPPRKWNEWYHPAQQATADATLIDERDMLRSIARSVAATSPVQPSIDGSIAWCRYCGVDMPSYHNATNADIPNHQTDCPWRQAAEYVARNAQGEGT